MCRNSRRRPSPVLVREMLIVAALVMANSLWSHRAFTAFSQSSNQGLRFELPANGNLRVENLRGAVIAEVWDQPYVSIAALTDSGEVLRSPAVIQSSDSLLSVRVPRVAGNAARVNLELRIPTRTHAAIFTATGPVEMR